MGRSHLFENADDYILLLKAARILNSHLEYILQSPITACLLIITLYEKSRSLFITGIIDTLA